MTSDDNSKKLDQILMLLRGEDGAPGLIQRQAAIEELLQPRDGSNGLVSKVNMMWRAHIWILCTLSGAIGYAAKTFFKI